MSNGKPAINPWFIAVTVTLATFMELLDTSIANVALPYIGGGLGRSYDEVTWILTTYLVANAVILPMSAWLSRVFGRRNYYLGCVALFSLTSLFCGLAPNLGIMLSSRVLQGLAGGGLAPVSQAILVDTFPPAKRASAFALYTIVIVTAPAIGPVLGGWITDNYNWRWIFFINIPIGFLSFFLSSKLLKDPPAFEAERASVRTNGKLNIDGIGIALIALASAALEVALDRGQIDDWFGSSFICWMLAIGVIGWIATVLWELRLKEPIIEFRLLASRNFAIANALLFVFGLDSGFLAARSLSHKSSSDSLCQPAHCSRSALRWRRHYVVLRHLHARNRLCPLRSGQGLPRPWLWLLFCTSKRARIFAIEARPEQSSIQPHEPLP